MDTLKDTLFDVVIAGTGLSQSLLALALSRSEKKTLQVDKNDYYGGPDAALSLQDAEKWVEAVNRGSCEFWDARIERQEPPSQEAPDRDALSLGYSRSYSLALSPQIIYCRSTLLPTLVASKVYRQLEFLAVGAWWIYQDKSPNTSSEGGSYGRLKKIPSGREDIFSDQTIDLRAKRNLMKFLKVVQDVESHAQIIESFGKTSLDEYLATHYDVSPALRSTIHALTLSLAPPSQTPLSYALPTITRHLSSIGIFGPGFAAVIPKWGGLSEIAQVSCRANAVGGGIYMLGHGVEQVKDERPDAASEGRIVRLTGGASIRTRWTVGGREDLPTKAGTNEAKPASLSSRSITVVATALSTLFPPTADGSPPSACSVIVFPSESITVEDSKSDRPVYVIAHSSDTGECPASQCILYASIGTGGSKGQTMLSKAVELLLEDQGVDLQRRLFTLSYSSRIPEVETEKINQGPENPDSDASQPLILPTINRSLAFDDRILQNVRQVWQKLTGDTDGFMTFDDREAGAYDDEPGD